MNKKLIAIIISVSTLAINAFSAQNQKVIILGGKNGWTGLSKQEGIAVGNGRFGYSALKLSTDSRKQDDDTDLLVDFEGGRVRDITGAYNVSSNDLILSSEAVMGQGAALATGSGGLLLKGDDNAIFGKEGPMGSFLIEFWLNPSIVENGEVFFSWRSSRSAAGYPMYQRITASFFSNKVEWVFTNVFSGYVKDGGEVLLRSQKTVIPGVWAHHSISFNQDTGLLEYRINGRLEALSYLTESGHEYDGSIYEAILGTVANIELCSQYTGLVDDFGIKRTSESETSVALRADAYDLEGGRFESKPFIMNPGTSLVRIDALMQRPPQTEIELFVRSGDNFYNWTDNYPEWINVMSGEEIQGVEGRYFQVAGNLLPDGSGSESPVLTELKIYCDELPPPVAPFKVDASPGNESVRLSWSRSVDDSVGGYYVYYGVRPGEYLGGDAGEGVSPLDVGNITSLDITNLTNGKIYYFSVAAYSKYNKEIVGKLSQEVYARPYAADRRTMISQGAGGT